MDAKVIVALGAVACFYCLPSILRTIIKHRKLSAIPTIGPSGILTSFIGGLRFYKDGGDMVQEGYDKYRGSIFKVPMLTQWMVAITGPQLIEEVRRASEDQLSSIDAFAETFHTDVLFGSEFHQHNYHIETFRTILTRNIAVATRFPDIRDEIAVAIAESIPAKGNEWTTLTAYKLVSSIICRTTNRFFIGLPLCRDPDYRSLNVQFALDVIAAANILNLFPVSTRWFVVRFLKKVPEGIKRGINHLEPMIKERLEQLEKYGDDDWPDKPNDAITWFLDANEPRLRDVRTLAICVLILNFVSIHTTTQTCTNALFFLANHPEYAQPLREEIEAVIGEEGWTKSAIDKLSKMDSFMRESQRLTANGAFTVRRKLRKDFTFSNGVTVPAGCVIGIPHRSVQCDPEIYSDPYVFDGFRFSKMRGTEEDSTKYGATTLTSDHFAFGQGRHACPGRFFATIEIKTILAHILLNYDVRMANGRGRPSEWWFGMLSVPDPTAEVMFRKRL